MNSYLEFFQTEIGPYLGSRDRKSLRQQLQDIRKLWARYRSIPYHYFKHRLYERTARPDFIDYLPANLIRHFRRSCNPPSLLHILNDKREAVRVLSGKGIRCVETLFSVTAHGVIRRSDGAQVEAYVAADELRKHDGALFIKPIDSRSGFGASSLQADRVDAALIRSLRNVVIQPALSNHPILEALHPVTLNTVRLCTFLEDGRCTIIAAFLRVARGDAMVDNLSQGGIAIGIDLASGMLNSTGITLAKHGRHVYTAHPDTSVQFAGVTLPWWRETLELAERAALGLAPHMTLGLDIAITPDGPVFVEANGAGDIVSPQEACGPLGKTCLGRRVLDHWLRK
jgi:hypothetical protein